MQERDFPNLERRRFIGLCGAAAALAIHPSLASAASTPDKGVRTLSLHSLNTGEKLKIDYWIDGRYEPEALSQLHVIMRDHRCDEVSEIDHGLYDLMHRLSSRLESGREIEIISGFRSPQSNAQMRRQSKGVAKKSYHMKGMAADIRIPGRSLGDVYRSAVALREGGVSYYSKSGFVHVDVGPVRTWGKKPRV